MNNPQDNDAHPYAPQEDQAAQAKKPEASQPATDAPLTIAQAKKQCCEKLTKLFTGTLMNERLMKMAGGDASRVAKNLAAFLSIISQDDGGSKDNNKKKYLFQCTIASLTTCFLESMNMQLPFDSRQLVSMVIYEYPHGFEAELDISYKGFVNALNKHYRNAFVECKLVFEADVFTADIDGRIASYHYKPADPFAVVTEDFKGIKGGYCYFSYTDTDGKPTSRLVFLSKTQILKNRERARQKYVWNSDPKAMGEKTCIREGSKLPFAAIDLDLDIEEVANRHYQLEDKSTGDDRLKQLMDAQMEVVNGKQDKTNVEGSGDAAKKPSDSVSPPSAANATAEPTTAATQTPAKVSGSGDASVPTNDANGPAGTGDVPIPRGSNIHTGEPVQLQPNASDNADENEPKNTISDADFEEVPKQ